ncbi:8541_t:CDS:2 [Acaulospora morrowiae]|uniref:8541_t:CDS:1 n=1 Tax=Acaulospora morrowiae TaxID=94023 RepID=A0A9N9FET4_9GLOM|nr:8541_t:CDS:2 [Acaulospora morrowiae]
MLSVTKHVFHDVTFTILLALYLIRLIYTIPRSHTSHRHLNSYTRPYQFFSLDAKGVWIPQPMIVDAFGFFVLLGQIVSLNEFAILSGFNMDRNEPKKASFWITLHYIVWSFFCWVIIASLIYFGSRLTGITLRHIEDTKEAAFLCTLPYHRSYLEHLEVSYSYDECRHNNDIGHGNKQQKFQFHHMIVHLQKLMKLCHTQRGNECNRARGNQIYIVK